MSHPVSDCDVHNLCLHQWFELQAKKTPDTVAVVFEKNRLTYEALNRKANQLAHQLRKQGVGPDVLVSLYLERSPHMLVGILGILKSGGAYLPLDLSYPKERLAFMMRDANTSLLITQRTLSHNLKQKDTTVICIDDDFTDESDTAPEVDMTPDSLAYCIYTSGSTGTPKGVLITHRNVVRLFTATNHWFGFAPTDVWSMFHSYAFDVSVCEIWGALLYGGRLVVVPYLTSRTPADFYELLEREAVTVLSQTPSAFQQLLWAEDSAPEPRPLKLRYILFAGEKLETRILKPWVERHGDQNPKLINLYGITETTVHATYRPIESKDLDKPSVIGLPIPDLRILLLDENLQPVEEGQPGELCVAGPGLARGYLNRNELTTSRFVTAHGTRLYRSGDLARKYSDRDFEYIGRIDNQVKIRGHRIELGEIETVLHRHSAVRTAVVIARDHRLIAYIVAKEIVPTITELRNFILHRLPEYMAPAAFIFLDSIPLNANGKVDRKALPLRGTTRPALTQPYTKPETEQEIALAGIWSAVLDITPIGIDDNFFELGGDSIRMIQVLAQAQEKGISLTPAQLFETPTIQALAGAGFKSASDKLRVVPFEMISKEDRKRLPAEIDDAYPLTALQAGMHYHSEMNPLSGIFHDVFSYRIGFALDTSRLEAALQRLVDRHEILRTAFDFTSCSEPLQLVYHKVSATLSLEDLSSLSSTLQDEALLSWIDKEKRQPFDYCKAPLLRFHVQQLSDKDFQFIVSFYHAIFDGWSLAVMVSEVLYDYVTTCRGSSKGIEPPKTLYRTFVAREREAVASADYRQFWVEYLRGAPRQVLPRWPKSYRQGGNDQLRGPELSLEPEIFQRLRQLAGTAGVPLRTVLLAAHFRTIQCLTENEEVVSGVVMNGRPEQRDGDRMLGLFLNVVPMRMNLSGGTWLELVRRTYETERTILPYRRYPLSEIQKQVKEGDLYEAAFNYVNWHAFQPLQEDLEIEFSEGPYFEANNFTLLANFVLNVDGTGLSIHMDYDPENMADAQIIAFGNYYVATLARLVSQPEFHYEAFNPLPETERRQQLISWNETSRAYPQNRCIHELFEDQAKINPEAIALVGKDATLTYGELNQCADQLAGHLRSRGLDPGGLVGIFMERSLGMITAMLGILKAGGAYVPLDTAYPDERLEWMARDSGLKIVLTQNDNLSKAPFEKLEVINLNAIDKVGSENRANPTVNSSNLAYVLYTSGSTGVPKGVEIPHHGVVRLLHGVDYVSLDAKQTILHHSSPSFDASTFEVWGALLHGARCVLSPEKELAPRQLGEAIHSHRVTTLWLTAAYYNTVIEEAPHILDGVTQLLVGGEALSVKHIRLGLQQLPNTRIINGYGPTESTTFACCHPITPVLPEGMHSIPIGRPINNTRIYILNARLEPVPVGSMGELFIAGDGLARGYLNRPELTAEKFILHSFDKGPKFKLYRTGDLARYLPNGDIEFIGRRDHQVKIRGYRIELGEIETALLQHEGVKEAIVLAREDPAGDKILVGYVVGKNKPVPSIEDLWNFLKQRLPGFMVPGTIIFLESLPLNSNGKVDRKALPAPDQNRPELEQEYQEPQTPTEKKLANIWCEVIEIEKIGIHDNFFELGGHSLTAMRVINRLRNAFGRDIPLLVLFDNPTIAKLSAQIQKQS